MRRTSLILLHSSLSFGSAATLSQPPLFSTLHFNCKWWMVSHGGWKHLKFGSRAGCNLFSGRCLVQGNVASAKVLVPRNNDNTLAYGRW